MRTRVAIALPLLLIASGAIWLVAPQGAAQQQLQCTLQSPQPAEPLEMNTVVSDPRTSQFRDPLFKHVIMQKEVYDCVENPGGAGERRFVRDAETFIEIIQRGQAGRTTTVEKRVEDITCDKGPSETGAFGASCTARDVPLQQTPINFGCSPFAAQPTDPVAMNTVLTSRQDMIKTMKVDKELLSCPGAPPGGGRGHLYLFTEIVEQRAGAPGADTIRPTEKKFQAILCVVPENETRVDRCFHFIPAPVNG
jgi:hypothetical protein